MEDYEEKRQRALDTSLSYIAECLGFTVEKISGSKYLTLKEHDSVRIYNDKTYTRFSDHSGGTSIDFVMNFTNHDTFPDAVDFINELSGQPQYREFSLHKEEKKEKEDTAEFVLPEKNSDYRHTYAYLTNRGISRKTIDLFIHQKILYEEKVHHNMVFIGYDEENIPRFAFQRGTYDINGKKFKRDVSGSQKEYGVHLDGNNGCVHVFEASIDMMSYIDIKGKDGTSYIALDGLSELPLDHYLDNHKDITKICFCLDSDEPGRNTAEKLRNKYESMGYEVNMDLPISKDWNEELINSLPINKTIRR